MEIVPSFEGKTSVYNPYSNISSITSRRATVKNPVNTGDDEGLHGEEINIFMEQLAEIQRLERGNTFTDLGDFTIAHIAGMIEWRISNSSHFDCQLCKSVLSNDRKIRQAFLGNNNSTRPCQSTFDVCTIADHFLKIEVLKGQFNLVTIQQAIISSLDFENLYTDADFLKHSDHKLYLIKHILSEYVRIKGVHLAKTYAFKENQKLMRQKLSKLILHYHQ